MLVRLLQEDAFMFFHKQTLIHKKEIAKVSRKSIILCFLIKKTIRPSLLYKSVRLCNRRLSAGVDARKVSTRKCVYVFP